MHIILVNIISSGGRMKGSKASSGAQCHSCHTSCDSCQYHSCHTSCDSCHTNCDSCQYYCCHTSCDSCQYHRSSLRSLGSLSGRLVRGPELRVPEGGVRHPLDPLLHPLPRQPARGQRHQLAAVQLLKQVIYYDTRLGMFVRLWKQVI